MHFTGFLLSLTLILFFHNENRRLGLAVVEDHAIYVSVIEVEKAASNHNGILKVKVFIDDLQDVIYNKTGNRKSYRGGCQSNDTELEAYFKHHIQLTVNSESMDIVLSDCERLEDALWLNFSFKSEYDWTELNISADYFMELFPTQSNIVSITNAADRQFSRLNKGNHKAEFTFSR